MLLKYKCQNCGEIHETSSLELLFECPSCGAEWRHNHCGGPELSAFLSEEEKREVEKFLSKKFRFSYGVVTDEYEGEWWAKRGINIEGKQIEIIIDSDCDFDYVYARYVDHTKLEDVYFHLDIAFRLKGKCLFVNRGENWPEEWFPGLVFYPDKKRLKLKKEQLYKK